MVNDESSHFDEVVFENTPLYDHLKEVGCDGFECAAHQGSSLYHKDKTVFNWKKFRNCVHKVLLLPKRIVKWCSNLVYFIVFQDVKHLDGKLLFDFLDVIVDEKALIEEDHFFLKNFAADVIPSNTSPGYPSSAYRISLSAGMLLSFLTIKQYHPKLTLCGLPSDQFNKCFIFFTGGWLLMSSTQYVFWLYYRRSAIIGIGKLRELTLIMRSLLDLMKKCLRIIQEAEMVSRGFTLASLSIPAERLELSSGLPFHTPQRQCAELRESVFIWAKECFLKYRETTLMLLDLISIQKDLDIPSHYIATVNLEEFGPLIQLKCQSEDEKIKLMAASDHFSLSAIKSVIQLMEVQQSELFRRLGLCILAAEPFTAKREYLVVKTLWKISWCIKRLLNYCKETFAIIKKSHQYYRSIETVDKDEIETSQRPQTCRSVLHDVNVAVHSLSLHLRAALMRINHVEEQLDLMEKDTAVLAINLPVLQDLSELESCMGEVRSEVESSIFCLEESEVQIALLQGKNKISPSNTEEIPYDEENLYPEHTADSAPINIFEIGDPMVEDQVFESTDDKHDVIKCVDEESDWLEDKAKMLIDKEASANLFKELKSVLVVKQEEHRLREQKAVSANLIGSVQKAENEFIDKNSLKMQPHESCVKDVIGISSESAAEEKTLPQSDRKTNQNYSNLSSASDVNFQQNLQSQKTSKQSLKSGKDEACSDEEQQNYHTITESLMDKDSTTCFNNSTIHEENTSTSEDGSLISPNHEFYSSFDRPSFASSLASLAAERSKRLGLNEETFTIESLGDSEDDDDTV